MQKLLHSLLLGSALTLAAAVGHAGDRSGRDIGSGLGGVDVNVGLGGKRGLDTNVDVSLGGKKGVDADVDVSLGGNKGIDADVDATIGGRNGVDADVDLSVGGKDGLDAGARVGIDDSVDVNIGLGVDNSNAAVKPDIDPNAPDDDTDRGGLTAEQREAFSRMSRSERQAVLKRCGSIDASSHDAALADLCKLLRLSASR